MKFDKVNAVVIVSAVAALIFWNGYLQKKYPHFSAGVAQSEIPVEGSSTPDVGGALSESQMKTNSETLLEAENLNLESLDLESRTLENPELFVVFDNTGSLKEASLKKYQNDARTGPFQVLGPNGLSIRGSTSLNLPRFSPMSAIRNGRSISFKSQEGSWLVTQTFTLPEKGYHLEVDFTWENKADISSELTSYTHSMWSVPRQVKSSSWLPADQSNHPTQLILNNGKVKWSGLQGVASKTIVDHGMLETLNFIGVDQHYVFGVWLPEAKLSTYHATMLEDGLHTLMYWNQGQVIPGGKVNVPLSLWLGPKEPKLLAAAHPELPTAVDLGFFGFVAKFILLLLDSINVWVNNWGVTICIATLVIRCLLFPLGWKAASNQAKMQEIQPLLTNVQQKYKNNPEMLRKEMAAIMGKHKVNPVSGCLPMLLQMPVFFAFFSVLRTDIDLRHAKFFGWITDLSASDPYYVLPVLATGLMWLSMQGMPQGNMDAQQQKIMKWVFPIMLGLFFLTAPAGLAIYNMSGIVLTMIQQKFIKKKIGKVK